MGLEAKFTGDIDGMFKAFLLEVERQIIESLCRIGEEAVSMAKTIPPERGFTDRTGNLRSSIGYVVFKDGKPVNIAFEAVKGRSRRSTRRTTFSPADRRKLYRRLYAGCSSRNELRRSRGKQRARCSYFRRETSRKSHS